MRFTNAIGFRGKFYALNLQGALAVIEDIDSVLKITYAGKRRAAPVKVCNKEVAEDMVYVPTHQPHAIMECTAATHAGKERSVAAIKDDTTTLQHMKELP